MKIRNFSSFAEIKLKQRTVDGCHCMEKHIYKAICHIWEIIEIFGVDSKLPINIMCIKKLLNYVKLYGIMIISSKEMRDRFGISYSDKFTDD